MAEHRDIYTEDGVPYCGLCGWAIAIGGECGEAPAEVTAIASAVATDRYVVHVTLARPEHDQPTRPVSVTTYVTVPRTDDSEADAEAAEQGAIDALRPYLNNSATYRALAVAIAGDK